ncbi:MAG: Zn-ribbon domain-containing OB-fold protein [Solirubrobacteraceae bacterium]
MTELQIQRCEVCGTSAFPDRLWCPSCGASAFQPVPAGRGRVEEETTLRRSAEPITLGTVRLEAGPLVIARLAAGAKAGTHVRLERTREGTIWARD